MFRNVARPLTTTAPRSVAPRSFSALAPRMGEGDTGAPRQGGAAQGYVYLAVDRWHSTRGDTEANLNQ